MLLMELIIGMLFFYGYLKLGVFRGPVFQCKQQALHLVQEISFQRMISFYLVQGSEYSKQVLKILIAKI